MKNVPAPENVGDRVEQMAESMVRATCAALAVLILGGPPEPELPDEVIERAAQEASGMMDVSSELCKIAIVDPKTIQDGYDADSAAEVHLHRWYTYLDQVVQGCALYTTWLKAGYIIEPNPVVIWVASWSRALTELRDEVGTLIRNRSETPRVFSFGKVPANYDKKA